MSVQVCTIRAARADELPALLAVDHAASTLFAAAGLHLALPSDHPFVLSEAQRWTRSIALSRAFVAVHDDVPIAFAALDLVDRAPYLDQLAVQPWAMRQGIGRALVQRAIAWAAGAPLWLTTYDHLPFNQPYYERLGFVPVDDARCGPELQQILAWQRAVLPEPNHRVAMVRPVAT